jgi:hypothetical protein
VLKTSAAQKAKTAKSYHSIIVPVLAAKRSRIDDFCVCAASIVPAGADVFKGAPPLPSI